MDDYIKREALRDALYDADAITMNGVKILNQFPSSDVEPVKHGRWEEADWVEIGCQGFEIIRTPKAALRCSNCKNCFKKELLWKDNYCPNCGAKMDDE